ncbi:MAG: hypothetical protein JST84_16180 [Acidobacteria bacterium]|nr:hypothetical protein [Acidobacteriota bacterium]
MLTPLARLYPAAIFSYFIFAVLLLSQSSQAETTSYYVLQPAAPLGGSPSSLLMQSSYLDVPAGAILSVHLMKGHQIVSTSKLEFTAAYKNTSVFPSQIVSFLASGSSTVPGEPIAGAKLYSGITDLTPVAANPSQYNFLWSLSEGVIATPGQAIVTGGTQTVSFVDLRLSAIPASVRQSDQKPGSILFYHRYLSSIGTSTGNNTTLSITNTSLTDSTKVRLFFIAAVDCQPIEQAICLAAQQTTTFLMSDFDPGTTGYVIAVACDAQGRPTQFNWLIGNAQIRQTSPLNNQKFDSTLSALAIAKRTSGAVIPVSNVSEMAFDDTTYDRLPAQLAADNLPSQGTSAINANATIISLYRPLANLAGGSVNTQTNFSLNNSSAQSTTTTQTIGCYSDVRLSSLRLNPTLATILPVGKTGWMRISAGDNGPLLGAQFNSGLYSSGATLRAVTFASDYRMSIPIKAPGC